MTDERFPLLIKSETYRCALTSLKTGVFSPIHIRTDEMFAGK